MVYILVGMGIYFYLMDQPDLRLTQIYPLENGTALAIGTDDQDEENPLLQVWLTGIDDRSEWITELEGNYIPPFDPNHAYPPMAHDEKRAFILMGQDNGLEQRMTGITCLELENGGELWSNFEQPAGDAEFGAVYQWKGSLVTTHRAIRSQKDRLFIVGRNPDDGNMIWTRIFEVPSTQETYWQNRIQFLPKNILIHNDSLHLVDLTSGKLIRSWAGSSPSFTGGWLFYQRGMSLRALETATMTDTLLFADPEVQLLEEDAPRVGYSGFYNGYPMHFNQNLGLVSLTDSLPEQSKLTGSPIETVHPNSVTYPLVHTRPAFLNEDWPRYVPFFFSFTEDDTLQKYFPETLGDRSLAGTRFMVLDLAAGKPALVSDQLFEEGWQGQMTTWQGNHYFIGTDPVYPENPLVIKIDGRTGALDKAIRSTYPFEGLHPAYPHLPIGNRLWVTGEKHWTALSIPDLGLQFTTNDSISFAPVTEEYQKKFGYTP